MTSSKLSLTLGLIVTAIIVLFTIVSMAFILTGNAARLESSRSLNLAYALLSLGGEAIALVGFLSGAYALLKRQPSGYQAALGVGLNLVGLVLFFLPTIALLFNSFSGFLESFIQ